MSDKNIEILNALKDWWLHETTPEKFYEQGWRQRNDMVRKRRRELYRLLREEWGADNNVRRIIK